MYVLAHNGSRILGGGELGTALLLAGLQERGHRVKMLCRDRAIAERVGSYGIPTGTLRVGGDVMLHDAARAAAVFRRERPDALILTTFKKVVLAGMAARMAGVPRVVQRIVLQTDLPSRGARYRLALRRFVDVIALNAESMRAPFLAADPRLHPARVLTILDGVRTPRPGREPGAVRRDLGIPPDAPVIGAVARLSRQKRFDRLLHAFSALPADVHCVLAGEGEARPALEALAAELGVAGRLHLPGFRRDVGDVLAALDVFVVSSDREGMANAMLEAMAAGLPVVSTPVSGAHEALSAAAGHAAPGIVTAGFDAAELADAIRAVLGDPGRRGEMAAAAARAVEERFSFEGMLDRWERVLAPGAAP